MNDFYSVLKQSIIDRGLRSPQDREAAYSQARTAMIRRLWSYDPPLAEDEIDVRIGQFDLAVERIETDVVEAFAAEPEPEPEPVTVGELDAADSGPPAVPVYDGYDEEADYTPAFGGTHAEALPEPDEPEDGEEAPAASSTDIKSLVDLLTSIDIRSLAVEEALNADPQDETAGEADADAARESSHAEAARLPAERDRLPAPAPPPRYDAVDDDGEDADEPAPEDMRMAYQPVAAPNPADRPPMRARDREARVDDREESARPRQPRREQRRPAPAPERRAPKRAAAPPPKRRTRAAASSTGGDRRIFLLFAAVGVLAVALIGVTAYVLWPVLTSQGPANVVGTPVETIPGGGATALPPPAEGVLQRFTLFDGSDPTVFDSDPSNPVRFDGNVARIASSADSAGARAVVGPGLASRLAGHNVRVTVMARAAVENGAASLRFAYQSGLAVSYWKSAELTSEFTAFELEWRLPVLQTDPTGNLIVIEPGIPGDGTAAEIGAIAIDLLD